MVTDIASKRRVDFDRCVCVENLSNGPSLRHDNVHHRLPIS